MSFFLKLLLASFLFANLSYAKTVVLHWESVEGAKQYEILVEKDGKSVVKTIVTKAQWSGDLGFGAYVYQIRAIDSLGRPGEWSQLNPIVVMAPAPTQKTPQDKSEALLIQNEALPLEWQELQGIEKYEIEINRGSEAVLSAESNSYDFKAQGLPEGVYNWRVRGVLELGSNYPTLASKKWKTDFSPFREVRIKYRSFSKIEIVYPMGEQWPPEDGLMKFKWKSVEGAEAYEVRVQRKNSDQKEKILISETTSTQVNVGKEGVYAWSVRPLTAINADHMEKSIRGAESVANFTLLRDYLAEGNTALIELSGVFTTTNYHFINENKNLKGDFEAKDLGMRLRGEYWFAPNWATSLGLEDTFFNLNGNVYQRLSVDALLKRRLDLGAGIFLGLAAGVEGRQYPEVQLGSTPNDVSVSENNATGAALALDFSKQFNERWSLRAKGHYFYPFSLGGGRVLGESESRRNISLGIQGLYWTQKTLGFAAGAHLESRSLAYRSSAEKKSIRMDGLYFFGSVIWRIEK